MFNCTAKYIHIVPWLSLSSTSQIFHYVPVKYWLLTYPPQTRGSTSVLSDSGNFLPFYLPHRSGIKQYSSVPNVYWNAFLGLTYDLLSDLLFLFSRSAVSNSVIPRTAAHQASLSFTISWSLLKLMSLKSVMPSNHSSSVVPFSSCFQSFPASGSFPMNWLFTSGVPSSGASASASVLPVNIQDWFPVGLTGLISLQSLELSRLFSNTTVEKNQFFSAQPSLWFNSHIHIWLLEKP